MNIKIRGVKVDVTPAIKEHIETKIGKLSKYLEKPETIETTVIYSKGRRITPRSLCSCRFSVR